MILNDEKPDKKTVITASGITATRENTKYIDIVNSQIYDHNEIGPENNSGTGAYFKYIDFIFLD